MKSRPNSNYVLQVMRDGDFDDPWGTAMAWAFAVAESLTYVAEDIPSELEFRPALAGAVIESYEDATVLEYLGYDVNTDDDGNIVDIVRRPRHDFAERLAAVQFAGRCLARYLDWCRAAGLDY